MILNTKTQEHSKQRLKNMVIEELQEKRKLNTHNTGHSVWKLQILKKKYRSIENGLIFFSFFSFSFIFLFSFMGISIIFWGQMRNWDPSLDLNSNIFVWACFLKRLTGLHFFKVSIPKEGSLFQSSPMRNFRFSLINNWTHRIQSF